MRSRDCSWAVNLDLPLALNLFGAKDSTLNADLASAAIEYGHLSVIFVFHMLGRGRTGATEAIGRGSGEWRRYFCPHREREWMIGAGDGARRGV